MEEVYLIFDIGKTNKKCFLFNKKFKEVHKVYKSFPEIKDEDGYPCENLAALVEWMHEEYRKINLDHAFEIIGINFSTYGASLVHLNEEMEVLLPLYNYLKPYPENILKQFRKEHDGLDNIEERTGSPYGGMLNVGLQLYWIKKNKREIYSQIKYSLHFPQYLSYLFHGRTVSEFTCIGCHSSLWNYQEENYHDWVFQEKIDQKFSPIFKSDKIFENSKFPNQMVGIGIHDSSAAAYTYLKSNKKPFLLISTGTWSITLNPFSEELISSEEMQQGALHYMQIDGQPIRASRLFIGKEYEVQTLELQKEYQLKPGWHRQIKFDPEVYQNLMKLNYDCFNFNFIEKQPLKKKVKFKSEVEALHQLMIELMNYQIDSIEIAKGKSEIFKIYVDGGFADNDIFLQILIHHYPKFKIRSTKSPLGSAIGAAMLLSNKKFGKKFLKKKYTMKKHASKFQEL